MDEAVPLRLPQRLAVRSCGGKKAQCKNINKPWKQIQAMKRKHYKVVDTGARRKGKNEADSQATREEPWASEFTW